MSNKQFLDDYGLKLYHKNIMKTIDERTVEEKFITYDEYKQLPDSKYTDGIWYNITDLDEIDTISINDDIESSSTTWSSYKIKSKLFSGDYNDLKNKPNFGSLAGMDITDVASKEQGLKAETAIQNVKINNVIQPKENNVVILPNTYPASNVVDIYDAESSEPISGKGVSLAIANKVDKGTKLSDYGITDAATSAQGLLADSSVQSVKIQGNAEEYKVGNNVVLPPYPTSLPSSDVPEWAKSESKPTYTLEELGAASAEQGELAEKAIQKVILNGITYENNEITLPNYPTSLPASDVADWAKAATKPTYTADEVGALSNNITHLSGDIAASEKGSANGVATLDENGLVPSSQLPSYVDDVLEFTNRFTFPDVGESGKVYVDTSKNTTYRWSGSTYVIIGTDLALGETASTAYAGDKGKANAEAIATLQEGKVDIIEGKGLSTNDFTDEYKNSIDNIPSEYAPIDAEKNIIINIQKNGENLTVDNNRNVNIIIPTQPSDIGAGTYSKPDGGITKDDFSEDVKESLLKADTALQSFTEEDPTVPNYVKAITEADITNWNNKSTFDGDYESLTNKPTIPSIEGLATEEQVNAKYTKPAGGIPAEDLANGVIPTELPASNVVDSYDAEGTAPVSGKAITAALQTITGCTLIDDTTNKKYKLGIENGKIYIEEISE